MPFDGRGRCGALCSVAGQCRWRGALYAGMICRIHPDERERSVPGTVQEAVREENETSKSFLKNDGVASFRKEMRDAFALEDR